jgi:hypothetical protein
MDKNSREQDNRTPDSEPRFSLLTELFLNGWLWVTMAGFALILYGASFLSYGPWKYRVFHPWAIVVGIFLVVIAFIKQKGIGEM